MKSISALVDATNFVAQDRGRPLHVFDTDKLSGNLSARMAKDHEQVLALDEKTYVLDKDTIVIADDSFARGIAGIMGGWIPAVSRTPGTSSSNPPGSIRRESPAPAASWALFPTRAIAFERGVDPEFVLPGLELATSLILEWCGGEASDVVIAGALPHRTSISSSIPPWWKAWAASSCPRAEIISILERLGFTVAQHATLHVTPPSWRAT
jgi:phenylalanyl-tRNA synthetase beta chain